MSRNPPDPDPPGREVAGAAADRATREASVTLGQTLPTDTVLYLLPSPHAAALGDTLFEAVLPAGGVEVLGHRAVVLGGSGECRPMAVVRAFHHAALMSPRPTPFRPSSEA